MKSTYGTGHLHNHLDPASYAADDDFDNMSFEYENQGNDSAKRGRFARGAGLIILLLVVLFVLQRFFLPVGPDLTSILQLVPLSGAVLVLIIGLGLISRARSVRKRNMASDWELKQEDTDYTVNSPGINVDASPGTARESVFQGPDTSAKSPFSGTGKGKKQKRAESAHSSGKDSGSQDSQEDTYGFETYRKWYRSRDEKMLFGVCGGIAERLDMDPTIVRALFALAFLSYGFSLVIYVVLAVILPKKPLHSLS